MNAPRCQTLNSQSTCPLKKKDSGHKKKERAPTTKQIQKTSAINLASLGTFFQSKAKENAGEPERSESREFAKDLFPLAAPDSDQDDPVKNSSRAFRAKKEFEESQQSSAGRAQIYKDILAHGYVDFFVSGFSLKSIDAQFEHLSKDQKASVL